ncbi:hypothetical protein OK016_27080 [Vibrio chagasii]|nr:hypothetical protein [Vibrio chagasii]
MIVAEDTPVDLAVDESIYGKRALITAKYALLAPDYVLLPEDKLGPLFLSTKNKVPQLLFDEGIYSENLTSLINPANVTVLSAY